MRVNPAGLRPSLWPRRLWATLAAWLLASPAAQSQELSAILTGPVESVPAGALVSVWLHSLNDSTNAVSLTSRARLEGRLAIKDRVFEVALELADPADAATVAVPGHGFVRREYKLALPAGIEGRGTLELLPPAANRLVLDIRKPEVPAGGAAGQTSQSEFTKHMQKGEQAKDRYDPADFFKEHFFGYEPFYFVAGTESPNAKFQISLRYQLVNSHGPLAEKVPAFKGLNVAYTQTSLWDWNALSSPFLDSSYKPEALYLWQHVNGRHASNWFRLDLQGGLQHESNGKGGLDSRSLNLVYLRPALRFGTEDGFQFVLQPRVWDYVGDLSDNPDIADYRGYVDLRATIGWARGLQLSAYGRMGDDWDHKSLQLDLTYPMMRLLSGSFSVYLQAQYFTGYGESFLLYQEKSDAVRIGFALYR